MVRRRGPRDDSDKIKASAAHGAKEGKRISQSLPSAAPPPPAACSREKPKLFGNKDVEDFVGVLEEMEAKEKAAQDKKEAEARTEAERAERAERKAKLKEENQARKDGERTPPSRLWARSGVTLSFYFCCFGSRQAKEKRRQRW